MPDRHSDFIHRENIAHFEAQLAVRSIHQGVRCLLSCLSRSEPSCSPTRRRRRAERPPSRSGARVGFRHGRAHAEALAFSSTLVAERPFAARSAGVQYD